MKPEGAFHRAPRPLILWAGVALVAGGTIFVLIVLAAIALGFWATAARGQGVPDLSGGLGALAGAAVTIGAFIAQVLNQRHVERRDQIAKGGAPPDPFASSPPSANGDGEINPHGGPDTP